MAQYVQRMDFCDKKNTKINLIYNVDDVHTIKDGNGKDIQRKIMCCNLSKSCNELSCPYRRV